MGGHCACIAIRRYELRGALFLLNMCSGAWHLANLLSDQGRFMWSY
jgi:hypothetical protein